jgi:CRP-like cAMP-binding protein
MEELKRCILREMNMDHSSLLEIVSLFEQVALPKGDFFLRSGKACTQMAFVVSGYLRMYDIAEGKEITFRLGSIKILCSSLELV